jgi:hypothetical protein
MPTYEKYTSLSGNEFIRASYKDGIEHIFPLDPANSDYQAYLKSLDEASTL